MSSDRPTDDPALLRSLERAALGTLAKKAQDGDGMAARALLARVDKMRADREAAPPVSTALDDAVAWLLESRRRTYKAAAARFGLDVEAVRAAGTQAREAKHAVLETVESWDAVLSMSKIEAMEWQLAELLRDFETLRDNPKASTALMGAHRQITELIERIATARGEIDDPNPEEAATDAELVEMLVDAVPELTPAQFDALLEAVDYRMQEARPRVVGGRDA